VKQFSISQVATQFGLRTSALRYYEEVGILPPVNRVSGRRRYDVAMLRRLAVIQRARQIGFTLNEIRELFTGYHPRISASHRWRELSLRKLAELEAAHERIMTMTNLLRRMANCECDALDDCGAGLLRNSCAQPPTHIVADFTGRTAASRMSERRKLRR
jgi:MerR family transcriptional regulator, redox-sensitive transcriptional activator SoxR